MYYRMQGLDAAVEYLRRAGNVGNLGDGDTGIGEAAVSSARADQFIAGIGQGFPEMLDAGLVEYAE